MKRKPVNVHYANYSTTDSDAGKTYATNIKMDAELVYDMDITPFIRIIMERKDLTIDKDGSERIDDENAISLIFEKTSARVLMTLLDKFVNGDSDDIELAFDDLEKTNQQELEWKKRMESDESNDSE